MLLFDLSNLWIGAISRQMSGLLEFFHIIYENCKRAALKNETDPQGYVNDDIEKKIGANRII